MLIRWDRLFADLEGRFEELAAADDAAESADRERVAAGGIGMTQRLSGSIGAAIRLRLAGGPMIGGSLSAVGPDWLLLAEGHGRECLVALDAVTVVEGLSSVTAPALRGLALRLDLRRALRGLSRDRSPVSLALAGWAPGADGATGPAGAAGSGEIAGTIDRVGADFVEIAVHAAWEPRRAAAVRSVALVPLSAVMLVRTVPLG